MPVDVEARLVAVPGLPICCLSASVMGDGPGNIPLTAASRPGHGRTGCRLLSYSGSWNIKMTHGFCLATFIGDFPCEHPWHLHSLGAVRQQVSRKNAEWLRRDVVGHLFHLRRLELLTLLRS